MISRYKKVAEQVALETIEECLRVARKKTSELPLPKGFTPVVRLDWSPRRRCSRGGVKRNKPFVSIAMALYVRQKESRQIFQEYRSFSKDPVIGSYKSSWENVLRGVVVHEMAHAIQHCIIKKGRKKIDYKKPHGEGFKKVYKLLRREIVNPRVKKEEGSLDLAGKTKKAPGE